MPIHLGELRAAAEWRRGRYGTNDEEWPVEEVLALIDVAQAARDYFGQSLRYADDPDAARAQESLRNALRSFTDPRYA